LFFEFTDIGDLTPLPGGRGPFIFNSLKDYDVDQPGQLSLGVT
jgi:hypothetical protein